MGKVTYETSIKVRSVVWVSTLDVSEATRERILEEVEHGKELSRRPVASAVAISRTRAYLLNFGISSNKIVETLSLRLSPVYGKRQVVILKISPDAYEINYRLNTRSTKLLGVTDTRSLEDQRRRERTAANDNLLTSAEGPRLELIRVQRLGRHSLDCDGSAVLHDDLVNLGVAHEIQVVVLGARGVYVSVRRVASTACVSVDPFEPVLCAVAGTEVLEVIDKGDALGLGGAEEVILDGVGVVTEGNFNGSLVTVDIWVNRVALSEALARVTEDPGVVEVALSSLDQENLEVMIEVGQAACNNTSATSTTAYDDVELIWHGAKMARLHLDSDPVLDAERTPKYVSMS
ncbi:hypothetical protein HG530_007183 [Fusarium avenaceum]|nr:hypothetical protein HG530_007183 [Fusarium avenaceum]